MQILEITNVLNSFSNFEAMHFDLHTRKYIIPKKNNSLNNISGCNLLITKRQHTFGVIGGRNVPRKIYTHIEKLTMAAHINKAYVLYW